MANAWHYVTVSYNAASNTRAIYVDGMLIGYDNPAIANAAPNINYAIGRAFAGGNEYFSGYMSDLLVANSALSAKQLNAASAGVQFGNFVNQGNFGGGNLVVAGGATVDLNGTVQTIASLQNLAGTGGTITNTNSAANATLILVPNSPATFAGTIQDGGGKVGLTIAGTGSQTLTGSNTYSGPTNISALTRIVTGSSALSSASALNLNAGAKLVVSSHSGTTVTVAQISSLTNSGLIDLTNNDLIIKSRRHRRPCHGNRPGQFGI